MKVPRMAGTWCFARVFLTTVKNTVLSESDSVSGRTQWEKGALQKNVFNVSCLHQHQALCGQRFSAK